MDRGSGGRPKSENKKSGRVNGVLLALARAAQRKGFVLRRRASRVGLVQAPSRFFGLAYVRCSTRDGEGVFISLGLTFLFQQQILVLRRVGCEWLRRDQRRTYSSRCYCYTAARAMLWLSRVFPLASVSYNEKRGAGGTHCHAWP